MHRLIIPFARLFVVCAIAVALAGSSFAHRAPVAQADDGLQAYVAAGGLLDDLCGPTGFGADLAGGCDACRLVDGAVVPVGASNAAATITSDPWLIVVSAFAEPVIRTANPACPVRAPPVV